MSTPETYDAYLMDDIESKTYTAWELAADWWWQDKYYISTGRAIYTDANCTASLQGVRLARLDFMDGVGIKQINRYVAPEMQVRLILRKRPSS